MKIHITKRRNTRRSQRKLCMWFMTIDCALQNSIFVLGYKYMNQDEFILLSSITFTNLGR
jgi:hypothetical protein